jgi:hypothetical protein
MGRVGAVACALAVAGAFAALLGAGSSPAGAGPILCAPVRVRRRPRLASAAAVPPSIVVFLHGWKVAPTRSSRERMLDPLTGPELGLGLRRQAKSSSLFGVRTRVAAWL